MHPQVTTRHKADSENWWFKIPPIQDNPINSVVATVNLVHTNSANVDHDSYNLLTRGYALSGSGQIEKVEVSTNEGQTWVPAKITYQEGRWSWTLWEAHLNLPTDGENRQPVEGAKQVTIWSRATDENGAQQVPDCDWNLRGVAYCAVGEKTMAL